MSFQWIETDESRRRQEGFSPQDNTVELQWVGYGSRDDQEAEVALQDIMPLSFRGLPLRTWRYDPVGAANWTATANYHVKERPEPPDTGETVFSCDTTGGTTHVTQAITQTDYVPSGETAPDFKGAVGVGKNNAVEGVDILVPSLKFTLAYRMPGADLTLAYIRTLMELTGKTNNATWKGFAAAELLFLGAQAKQSTQSDPEVTFNFAAIKNATSLAVGDDITVASKKGHEYMWVRYAETDDASANVLVPNPLSAHVAQVYYSAAFSLLGIGV